MAGKEQLLGVLAAASGPMSREELEDKIGESYRKFQTALDRGVKQGILEDTGDHHYVLTDKGREEALRRGEFKDIEDETEKEPAFARRETVEQGEEPTQESLATTPYQLFLKLGKQTGVVPLTLIKQTAEYVWDGGDYKDMRWVAQAMKDMDIRSDLRSRWWNSWRVKMRKAIPTDLPAEFFPDESKTGKKEEKGKRDYSLNEDDNPTYVGEGLGDLDHDEAFELAKIKAGAAVRRRNVTQPASAASQIEEVGKAFQAFREMVGEKAAGKSYVVKPGEGGYQIEEVDLNKPILIPQNEAAKPGPSFLVDNDGMVKELLPGQPVVIMKEAPRPVSTTGTHYLIDQRTGEVKEVSPGQPVVIIRESSPASQLTPIQVTDKNGNPMVLDLSTFIALEDHRDKQRQAKESHETKMEIAKSFKDLLNKAASAMGHISEGEEEE